MSTYEEDEARADRIAEIKEDIAGDLEARGMIVEKWQLEGDLFVSGSLLDILDVAAEWRSEIEELGG